MTNLSRMELNELIKFVEEAANLVSKYNSNDIKKIKNSIQQVENDITDYSHYNLNLKRYNHRNSNKNYLVGILPKFFQDRELFERNSDLARFANYLGINLSSPEKKSRFEIIGTMLCVISEMDEQSLDKLVKAIENLMSNENVLNGLKSIKQVEPSYSWNEVIRALSGNM